MKSSARCIAVPPPAAATRVRALSCRANSWSRDHRQAVGRPWITALAWALVPGLTPLVAQEPSPSVRVPHPSAAVRRIEAALNTTIDWNLPPTPLDEFGVQLAERMEIPVVVDVRAFREDRVDPPPLVGGRFRGVRLAAMLHWLLAPHYAGFTIRAEALFLTTDSEANEYPFVRFYRVGDLIDRWAVSLDPARVTRQPHRYFAHDAAGDDLLHLILITVYVSTRAGSGPPDVDFLASHRVLWALGPYSMHEDLEGLLNELQAASTDDRSAAGH